MKWQSGMIISNMVRKGRYVCRLVTPETAMKQEVDFILNTVGKLFCDIDYFAEYASKVAIENYKDSIRSNRVYSYDAREEGAYFCAIPKYLCNSLEMAVSALFIYSLYDHEEWPKTEKPWKDNFNTGEWKQHLKNDWIPEYFSCRGTSSIKYIQADTIEGFDIKNKILDLAVASRILSIIRYGDIHAWNAFDYLIETEDDYILFESWTTA